MPILTVCESSSSSLCSTSPLSFVLYQFQYRPFSVGLFIFFSRPLILHDISVWSSRLLLTSSTLRPEVMAKSAISPPATFQSRTQGDSRNLEQPGRIFCAIRGWLQCYNIVSSALAELWLWDTRRISLSMRVIRQQQHRRLLTKITWIMYTFSDVF